MTPDEKAVAEYVAALVEAAPALSPTQRDRLGLLLHSPRAEPHQAAA